MYQDEIKVPKERIAVLIGKKGELKKELENITKTKMYIDTKENIITLKSEDSLAVFNAKPIIRAIARGFNPKIAKLLTDEDYIIEIIDIKDFSGNSKKKLIRLKSRCIGTSGKARENIEEMTNTCVSIYGKTIAIMGKVEDVNLARSAFEEILRGAPHGNVYKRIQQRKNRFADLSYKK